MGAGFQIKKILREKKMTIKQLSEESGISLNTLYSITKRDSDRIDSVILNKILDAIDVSCGHILCEVKKFSDVNIIVKCEKCVHHDTYDCPAYDFRLGITSSKIKYCSYGQKESAE